MFTLLQSMADWLARAGLRRKADEAELTLPEPDHVWTLVEGPANWSLWMPGVRSLLDPARPPRAGSRYRVALRMRSGRLGFGTNREGHIVVAAVEPGARFAWSLVAGSHEERYDLRRSGARVACRAEAGEPAARILAELAREAAPLG